MAKIIEKTEKFEQLLSIFARDLAIQIPVQVARGTDDKFTCMYRVSYGVFGKVKIDSSMEIS